MMGGKNTVKPWGIITLLLIVGIGFAFRVTQGIDEAQRAVIKAYKAGARDKAPYLYSKTKGYKEIATILASEADDIGSKVFSIRTMNYASKAISAAFASKESSFLANLADIKTYIYEPIYKTDEYFPENTEGELIDYKLKVSARIIGEENLKVIYNRLLFLRENRGLFCSPVELGRAEAFYDALVYELNKEEPNSALVLRFYNEVSTESKIAESKLKIAIESELECYTGVKKVVKPKPVEKKEEVAKVEQKKKPTLVEEHLKITARIHFDFDKYNIRREYIPILNEVVKTLKENEFVKVRIEGFTDVIGSKEYNDKLALKRAEAVKKYLVSKGIPEEKIEIVGFGKERFIASNKDKIGRLTNRRVEFIVIKLQED